MRARRKTLVVIPAFNEDARIGAVIEAIRRFLPEADTLVLDDGSHDQTSSVSRSSGAMVLRHPFNLGVGTALQTAYKFAVTKEYEYVIQIDGDGQHDATFLPRFLIALEQSNADLVIGSRFLTKGGTAATSVRRVGITIFSKLLSLLIRERLTDPTSGFRAMNRKVLDYCIQDIYSFDYPDADFLLTLHREGFKIVEIPVQMGRRIGGQSQHRGLGPVFYVMKMFLSIFIILLRKKKIKERSV